MSQMAKHRKKQKIMFIMSKTGNWWCISFYYGMSIFLIQKKTINKTEVYTEPEYDKVKKFNDFQK